MNTALSLSIVTLTVDVMVEADVYCPGAYTTLRNGLGQLCTNYMTCLLTVKGNTCAIIGHNGHYTVVDSHARSVDGVINDKWKSVVYFDLITYANLRVHSKLLSS